MIESEIKLVERLWASGKTIGEIARLLPYKEYIAKREIAELKKKGVLQGKSGKSVENTKARVLQAYHDGITNPYEIAEMFEMDFHYVNTILGSAKLGRVRPKQNYKQRKVCENTQTIVEALRNGKTVRQISTEFGVSTQYVYQVKDKFVKE